MLPTEKQRRVERQQSATHPAFAAFSFVLVTDVLGFNACEKSKLHGCTLAPACSGGVNWVKHIGCPKVYLEACLARSCRGHKGAVIPVICAECCGALDMILLGLWRNLY